MSDRRADDTSIAPRRSLSGASGATGDAPTGAHARTRPGTVLPPMPKDAAGTPEEKPGRERRPRGERRSRQQGKQQGRVRPVDPDQRSTGRPSGSTRTPGRNPSGTAVQPAVRNRAPREARLRLTQVDPWSVTKTAFLLSIAIGVVMVVAVAVVWAVLGAAGLWDSINAAVQETIGGSGEPFDIEDYVGTSRVLGFTMIVAVVDIVLITMIATLGAFLYNLAATLLGGIEVTLAEED